MSGTRIHVAAIFHLPQMTICSSLMILLFCLANFEYHHLHPLQRWVTEFRGCGKRLGEKTIGPVKLKLAANAELSQYSMSSDGSDPPSLSKANEISSEKA